MSMKNNNSKCLCALLFVFVFLFSGVADAAKTKSEEPVIRVGLLRQVTSAEIQSDSSYQIVDGITGKVLEKSKFGSSIAEISGDKVKFSGKSAKNIRLEPNKEGQLFSVNGKKYRGIIELLNQGGKLTVINSLPVDQYLYGVLPKEMSPSWPLEALKAQAVAARSYALHTTGKHKNEGFDVCTTTDCQVYVGYEGENEKTNEAVDQTRGEVLVHDGEVILAVFHAAGGGYTEHSENVWSSPIPYLRGVEDFDQGTPNYQWSQEMKATEFVKKLQVKGYLLGDIKKIQLSPLKESPQKSQDRGISGRVLRMKIEGSKGSSTISGTELRSILGLKSSLFDLYIKEGSRGRKVQIEKAQSGWEKNKDAIIVIDGFGYGHGLGMSQWGAKSYAEKHEKEKNVYIQILTHYYSGAKVEKRYNGEKK